MIGVPQHRLDAAHYEGQTDERQRHHHPERREGDLDSQWREVAAQPAVFGIETGERDAGDGGGKREGQIDQRIHQSPTRKFVADQNPGHEEADRNG